MCLMPILGTHGNSTVVHPHDVNPVHYGIVSIIGAECVIKRSSFLLQRWAIN